jgi:hypothetical protein
LCSSWSRCSPRDPSEVDIAILVGALAAAGAGGANNLVQSNWIRDKGFAMGHYAPRIVSPITGDEEAALSGQRYSFPQDEKNMSRWRRRGLNLGARP